RTDSRVAGETPGLPLRTRLTVASLTPAWAAMSASRAVTEGDCTRHVSDCPPYPGVRRIPHGVAAVPPSVGRRRSGVGAARDPVAGQQLVLPLRGRVGQSRPRCLLAAEDGGVVGLEGAEEVAALGEGGAGDGLGQ